MKCFYCYEEYKVSKRPLLLIRDANLFSEGVGYCFEHQGKHTNENISKLMAQTEKDYRNAIGESLRQSMIQRPSVSVRGSWFDRIFRIF